MAEVPSRNVAETAATTGTATVEPPAESLAFGRPMTEARQLAQKWRVGLRDLAK
jgi:hypothetical protein